MSFSERADSQFKTLLAASSGAERAFRQNAWEQYARFGLPGRKSETWKYTNLKLEPMELSPVMSGASVQLPRAAADLMSAWSKEFDLVVTVNGVLRADMSTVRPKFLTALDFSKLNFILEDGWAGLATAMAKPGFQLEVSGVMLKPVLIVHAQTSPTSWSPSVNRISLAKGALLDLAEVHLGVDQAYLRSELTAVDLGADSVLNWVRIQEENLSAAHYSESQARLGEGAQFNVTQLQGGSGWCRSSLRAEILGERASAQMSGLTFARGKQHIDQRVEARHMKGQSESMQLFKSVLKDSARGVLNGKIFIAKDAQKVSSMQLNHNLLLSPQAEADTKPELEVYADDVKANHGASIGRLDEDKVFYLMSRGITRALAQQVLAHAFVGDVLMKVGPKSLRRLAESRVQGWLPNFSADMEHSMDGAKT